MAIIPSFTTRIDFPPGSASPTHYAIDPQNRTAIFLRGFRAVALATKRLRRRATARSAKSLVTGILSGALKPPAAPEMHLSPVFVDRKRLCVRRVRTETRK
jgi:hypothetical protein